MPPRYLSIVASLFAWFATATVSAAPGNWRGAAAKAPITPREPVWMAGYAARNAPSDGAIVDIFARALALEDGSGKRLVMVGMDLIEIPDDLRRALLDVAKAKHGLKPEELLLNVSHTHGGPMVSSKTVAHWGVDPVWGPRTDRYVESLVKIVDGLIGKTLAELRPATVEYHHARCGFAMNRRLKTPDGFRLGPNPDGPVDHDVPVLSVRTEKEGLIGLVFGYACHNTALGPTPKIHGDYAGFAQRKLETEHSKAVALFLAGCGGDQDPSPRRHLPDAEQNGLALASAVDGALSAPGVGLDPTLSIRLEDCLLPFAPLPPRAELQARAGAGDGFVSRRARWILKQWPNPGDQPADYRYPVQVIVFGRGLTLVALGGEPVVDYSLRLKKELASGPNRVWVAGYSNRVDAYIPNRRVLAEGGYEGTEAIIYQALPASFRPELEDRIVTTVRRLVESARSGGK